MRWFRNFKGGDYCLMGSYLADIDWFGTANSGTTVHQLYETLITILQHTMELYVPLKLQRHGEQGYPANLRRLNCLSLPLLEIMCYSGASEDRASFEFAFKKT